jgi:hypothetical protein
MIDVAEGAVVHTMALLVTFVAHYTDNLLSTIGAHAMTHTALKREKKRKYFIIP